MTRPRASLFEIGASGWCAAFGVVHVYWALGGRAGLPSDLQLADHPLLFMADLVAIPLCFGFAWLCVTSASFGRRRRTILLAVAAGFCLLHSLPSLTTYVWRAIEGGAAPPLTERERLALLVYEPIWLLGGLLLLAALMTERRRADRRP